MIRKITCKVDKFEFNVSTGKCFDYGAYMSIGCIYYTANGIVAAMTNNHFGVWWD